MNNYNGTDSHLAAGLGTRDRGCTDRAPARSAPGWSDRVTGRWVVGGGADWREAPKNVT
jgi:hypothetical protein